MKNMTNTARRKFLFGLAKTGALLPFASQMLGQKAQAAGGAKRVLFMYYPNGVVPHAWRPQQDNGSISTSSELSFGLGPLTPWHNKMIVLKNLNLDVGPGAGAHYNDMRGIITGNNQIGFNDASIDHLIAEKLGNEGVLSLGVRTGPKQDIMISKPRGYDSQSRPIPNNNPRDVANKLALRIGPSDGVSDSKKAMYEAILSDFNGLSDATLTNARQSKIDFHTNALIRLRDQAGTQVGECGFSTDALADPHTQSNNALSQTEWQMFPHLARAQVDNIVGAFACGLHKVATLQLSKGDENGNLVNYSFDECWQMAQDALAQGVKPGPNQQPVSAMTRWYNEHASHSASHNPGAVPHVAQVRWYHSLLAYTLEQLQTKGMLDDTLVVLFSEVGEGAKHGGAAGSVTLAGGASGEVDMGRVIYCGDGNNNGNRVWGTHQLFGDIARLAGANNIGGPWSGGVV